MLVSTRSLVPLIKLKQDEMKLMYPEFYKWYTTNKRRIGMHQVKFQKKLIELFSGLDRKIDLNYARLRRT